MALRLALLVIGLAVGPWVVGEAHADVRRVRPSRRPYIVEVGDPYRISRSTVDAESAKIEDMRVYLDQYGYPEYAEIQEIRPDWPWESYEVRLYYLRRNLQVDFGHAFTIEGFSALGLMKFQGGIPASKRMEIETALTAVEEPPRAAEVVAAEVVTTETASNAEPTSLDALVARVEAAADRAAQAAERAVEQSEAAERAANRTVSVVDKLLASDRR